MAKLGDMEDVELLRLSLVLFTLAIAGFVLLGERQLSIQLFIVCVSAFLTTDFGVYCPGTGGR